MKALRARTREGLARVVPRERVGWGGRSRPHGSERVVTCQKKKTRGYFESSSDSEEVVPFCFPFRNRFSSRRAMRAGDPQVAPHSSIDSDDSWSVLSLICGCNGSIGIGYTAMAASVSITPTNSATSLTSSKDELWSRRSVFVAMAVSSCERNIGSSQLKSQHLL